MERHPNMTPEQFRAFLWKNRHYFWAQWYIERGWLKSLQIELFQKD